MRSINHALTGALIGLTIGEPWVAVPVALVSHLVCDVIPHHGNQAAEERILKSKLFRNSLITDELLCVGLVIALSLSRPDHWLLAAICAFVATSPDLLFINRYRSALAGQTRHSSRVVQWLIDIQWFQRPIGAVVEVAWFIAGLILLRPFLV